VLAESPYDRVPLSDECLHSIVAKYMDGEPVDPLEFDQVRLRRPERGWRRERR